MPSDLIKRNCDEHLDWDCNYLTFIPGINIPLLLSDRCQQQLNAYDACKSAKDAGYLPDGSGGPPRDKPPGEEFPWGYAAIGAVVLFALVLLVKR